MKKVIFFALGLFLLVQSQNAQAAVQEWAIADGGNGHFYDFIRKSNNWENSITWQNAFSEANGLNYMGQAGYLATITSANENVFLSTGFSVPEESQFAWIGGYQSDNLAQPVGPWKWVTAEPWGYTNWGGIEPNGGTDNEYYAMYNIGTSFYGIASDLWADASNAPSRYDPVVGYFVEFNSPTVTPEPISASLFLLGGGLMALRRYRRKKA